MLLLVQLMVRFKLTLDLPITNVSQQRNFRFISGASWDGTSGNINTELPHELKIGNEVELKNIKQVQRILRHR